MRRPIPPDAHIQPARFYRIRNPFIGLLDPSLHTADYVFSRSFTLFSVICAVGCAVSDRLRDRLLYPTLISMAESSIKWSIAASVKSIETVQAILNYVYWAPLRQTQAEDPYWFYLSHVRSFPANALIVRPSQLGDH